jgi:transcription elongation factor Elf1
MTRFFCNVSAGINPCKICFESAYYGLSIPQKKHETLPTMQLFRCGHGMCDTCFTNMTTRVPSFSCPFCRAGNTSIIKFDSSKSSKSVNTLSQFIDVWESKLHLLGHMNHIFIQLHKQIISSYKEKKIQKKMEDKKMALIEQKKAEKTKRKESRNKAICHICGKNTFTSETQLSIHISAKHSTS